MSEGAHIYRGGSNPWLKEAACRRAGNEGRKPLSKLANRLRELQE